MFICQEISINLLSQKQDANKVLKTLLELHNTYNEQLYCSVINLRLDLKVFKQSAYVFNMPFVENKNLSPFIH